VTLVVINTDRSVYLLTYLPSAECLVLPLALKIDSDQHFQLKIFDFATAQIPKKNYFELRELVFCEKTDTSPKKMSGSVVD